MLVNCSPFRIFFMHMRERQTNFADNTFSIMGCVANNSILEFKYQWTLPAVAASKKKTSDYFLLVALDEFYFTLAWVRSKTFYCRSNHTYNEIEFLTFVNLSARDKGNNTKQNVCVRSTRTCAPRSLMSLSLPLHPLRVCVISRFASVCYAIAKKQ